MSYVNMDHAGWAQSNNASLKKHYAGKKTKAAAYWRTVPDELSPFQCRTMNILGIVFDGIYNAPISWTNVDWDYGAGVSVTLTHSLDLATFDFDKLTVLVFLCHEARIRCSVQQGGFRSLRLSFWPRSHEGDMARRHPNLDEAVAAFRSWFADDHPIAYKASETAAAE